MPLVIFMIKCSAENRSQKKTTHRNSRVVAGGRFLYHELDLLRCRVFTVGHYGGIPGVLHIPRN